MAKSYLIPGFPAPVYLDETGSNQYLETGTGAFINETGSGVVQSTGTATGVASASGVGASLVAGAGQADGVASASGVGSSVNGNQGVGSANGLAIANGVGASLVASAGSATGVATASGVGFGIGPITINEINTGGSTHRVFQRSVGQTYAPIALGGTYAGTAPVNMDFQVNLVGGGLVQDWTACTSVANDGAGNWTCTAPTVPQGYWYYISVRDHDSLTRTAAQTTNASGVGFILCLSVSQSNISNWWGDTSFQPVVDAGSMYSNGNGWWAMNLNLTGGSEGGRAMVNLTNKLRTLLGAGIAIGVMAYAYGGSAMTTWVSGGGGTNWNKLVDASTGYASASMGGDFEAFWSMDGEQPDGDSTTALNTTSYPITAVLNQILSLNGRTTATCHIGVMMIGTNIATHGGSPTQAQVDANWDYIRQAQWNETLSTGRYFTGSIEDMPHATVTGNDLHYGDTSYIELVNRAVNALGNHMGLLPYNSYGPSISSAVWKPGDTVITLSIANAIPGSTLVQGGGSTAGTSIPGFVVTSTGGQTISSTAFDGTKTKILITMSGNRGNSDTVTLTYGAGANPFGWSTGTGGANTNVVYDNNTAITGGSFGFPLRATLGGASNALPVGDGLASASMLLLGVG